MQKKQKIQKKSKIQRAKTIGSMKASLTGPAPQPINDHPPVCVPEETEFPATIEVEYEIRQCYSISSSETLIDQYYHDKYRDPDSDSCKEDRARFKRMYRAIVANEKALETVLQYVVLSEHDAMAEREEYVTAYFHRQLSFEDLLTSFGPLFHPEDRQWWEDLVAAYQRGVQRYEKMGDESSMFDLFLQVEPLRHAFSGTCQQSGWSLFKLEHQCADCGEIF